MAVTLYKILEVDKDCSAADIKASYRRLARVYHPDKNADSHEATARFQQLNDAYITLSDPQKRKAYDARLRSTPAKPPAARQQPSRNGSNTQSQTSRKREITNQTLTLLFERLGELNKNLNDMKQLHGLITERQKALEQHMNTRTIPVLDSLRREQEAQIEASRGWSGFVSRLREPKKERERRATTLEQNRLAVEEALEAQAHEFEVNKIKAAKARGYVAHYTRQKSELDRQLQALLEADLTGTDKFAVILALKETMRRHKEDPEEQTIWVILPC